MPYVNKPRPYAKEYKNYDGTDKKKRAERNQARRIMERAGAVRKGDGKESITEPLCRREDTAVKPESQVCVR
jgi:hypothetical protein